jgi:hypothetical protein
VTPFLDNIAAKGQYVHMLTQDRLKEILAYDPETGVFQWETSPNSQVRAGDFAGYTRPDNGYSIIIIDRKRYYAHRLAWFYVHGEWPLEIDHINRVRNDNRIENLREADRSINSRNRRTTASSGYTGVYYSKLRKKWLASIKVGGKRKHLGVYDNPEDANVARKKHEREIGW